MDPNHKPQSKNYPDAVECPHCNANLLISDQKYGIQSYFSGQHGICLACHKPLDSWELFLRFIRTKFFPERVLSLVGAIRTCIDLTLVPNTVQELTLAEYGIPEGSRILKISASPEAPLLPCIASNQIYPVNLENARRLRLYPVHVFKQEAPRAGTCYLWIIWIPKSVDDYSWKNLADAFESYHAGILEAVIIPANVSIESLLNRILLDLISKYVPQNRADAFLQSGATYSHQLNIILPLITNLLGLPSMPDKIRGMLNRLRDHRNDIAHKGRTPKPLTREDVAECLCAALFGFYYLRMTEQAVRREQQRQS